MGTIIIDAGRDGMKPTEAFIAGPRRDDSST